MVAISSAPDRSWDIMSESLPSWLFGNRPIATLPPVSAAMASTASFSRTLTECVAGKSLPSLSLTAFCAQAGDVQDDAPRPTARAAAPPARSPRRPQLVTTTSPPLAGSRGGRRGPPRTSGASGRDLGLFPLQRPLARVVLDVGHVGLRVLVHAVL